MISELLREDRAHILEYADASLRELRGSRIFITGGTGFVGTWLLEAFAAANAAYGLGATAVVLTRNRERFAHRAPHLATDPAIVPYDGDATSFAYPDGNFTHVVHAATERWFDPDRVHPLGILERDFAATQRVLAFAAACGARRVLFTSSGAVYGSSGTALAKISESFPGAPFLDQAKSLYGESKRLSELACHAYARQGGFAVVIARLFAFVGPHLPLDEGYAVGNFLRDAIAGRPIAVAGDGTPRRSYLYAADLAVWLWTILLRGAPGAVYNVGSPEGLSIRALAEAVARVTGSQHGVTVARTADSHASPASYVPDTALAQSTLGLRVWVDLQSALARSFAYLVREKGSPVA